MTPRLRGLAAGLALGAGLGLACPSAAQQDAATGGDAAAEDSAQQERERAREARRAERAAERARQDAGGAAVRFGGFTNEDPDAPVVITSDQLELRRYDGTALFTGDVLAVQGEMRLRGEWMLVKYVLEPDGSVGSEIESVTARDDVLLVTPDEAASGDNGVYYPIDNQAYMRRNVVVTQGPNTITGDWMTVNLETGDGRVEGRVRTVLEQAPDDAAN